MKTEDQVKERIAELSARSELNQQAISALRWVIERADDGMGYYKSRKPKFKNETKV